MMRISKTITALLFIVYAGLSYGQDAQEIIRRVQSKYDNITDAKATFTQTLKGSGGKGTSSSGVIYIKKQNNYRIEAGNQVIITDGVTSWVYSPNKKQVVIDNYKDDGSTFSPNKFLFSYPENFYSDLEGEENIGGANCYVIKLTPRSGSNVKSAKIWIDSSDDLIRKITISTNQSTNTYTLKDITLDAGVSSSKFTFSPPSGVEVIDLR